MRLLILVFSPKWRGALINLDFWGLNRKIFACGAYCKAKNPQKFSACGGLGGGGVLINLRFPESEFWGVLINLTFQKSELEGGA